MGFFTHLKKGIASVALGALAFAAFPFQAVNAQLMFTDAMEIPSWSVEAIEELMDQGVINGNDDGSFAPNRQLNRAEVSKIIVLAAGLPIDTTGGSPFPDVNEGDWFYDYVVTMYNYGYINGYPDGLFRPAVGINRAEIGKMVVNAFELNQDLSGAPHFDDVRAGDWFYGFVETAYNNGLMRGYGDGTFGPANPVTRAETVKIVYDSQLAVMVPTGPAEGTMEVALSMDTPRGTNIPFNATSVPFLTVELTASDDSDVEISSMTFTRLGLGDNDDFKNVWMEIDGFKVGNDKSVNNDDIVGLRFNPPIVIPAGMTLMADVVASAKYTNADKNIGHHNRFALVMADDIVSTAENIVGDFPIEGEEMEVASYEVSTLRMSSLGSDTTIDVGDSFIEIGKFRMLNSSNTNKDVEVRAITFKNDGTAELEDTLENVALYVSGEQISAETIIDGDYMTFRLDNGITGGYVIEDGDSRIFSVRADVVSAERGDTINFKVDNYEDIVGIEIGTSFGIKVVAGDTGLQISDSDTKKTTDASCTPGTDSAEDNCARLHMYVVDSGDLNVSRDPASLGNQEYAPGSNDVVFMTARMVVDQPLLTDGVQVFLADGSANGGKLLTDFNERFDNFRLFLNDKLIDSENDFQGPATCNTSTPDCYLDFNTTFEIAGTSILKVVGNVADVAETGDKLKMTVRATDFQSVEYISTGDQVVTGQLLGSASASFVEVAKSELIISETSGLSNGDKLVAGVDDVTFMEFVLDNNDSGDVNVTSVTVQVDQTDNTTGTTNGESGSVRNYGNFTGAVFVDGTQQGSAKNLSSDGTATFNDLSVVIPSAGQKEFTIVMDTIESSAAVITTTTGGGVAESGVANWDVVSTTGINVGDIITVTDGTNTESKAVTAIVDADTLTVDSVATNDYADGSTVTVKHQMKLDVTAVDADNVENGQNVTVNANGAGALATGNELQGTLFELVASGNLNVSLGSTVFSDILIANQEDVEILKVRFNASNDEVHVKDLYFESDADAAAGDRVDFKLYNEAGQLIQEKQMTGGKLHFQLANQNRIRVPKDDSTYVTVKVDVRDITKANQTGKRLQIGLETGHSTEGIEALTAATGADIATPAAGWGDVTSEMFVAYRTQISVNHATSQNFSGNPTLGSQEIYRFTVTADQARQAELGQLKFQVDLAGMQTADNATFNVYQVDGNSVNTNNTVTGTITDTFTAAADVSGVVTVPFTNQKLGDGDSRTYALYMDQTTDNASARADDDSVAVTILTDSVYTAPEAKAGNDITLAGSTITVTGTPLAGGEDPAAANVVIGGVTIAVDIVAGETNAQIATRIAAAIDGDAKFSASATDNVVTVTASDGATTSTIDASDIVTKVDAANVADNDTSMTTVYGGNIVWSDESATNHSDTTSDWFNGYLLDVDTTAQVNAD